MPGGFPDSDTALLLVPYGFHLYLHTRRSFHHFAEAVNTPGQEQAIDQPTDLLTSPALPGPVGRAVAAGRTFAPEKRSGATDLELADTHRDVVAPGTCG